MSHKRKKRGFALLSKEQRSKNASLAGKIAHETGRAHEWTKEEANDAGKKGGRFLKGSKYK